MKPLEGNMPGTPRPDPVSTKRQRIAELARNCPDMSFTNLAHHIDLEWMLTAHGHTRRDGAVGVDGQTAEEYEANLEANLQNLLDRAKSGTYVAPPVRRAHIPKPGSPNETRPLGIPMCRSYCTSLQRRWGLKEVSSITGSYFSDETDFRVQVRRFGLRKPAMISDVSLIHQGA